MCVARTFSEPLHQASWHGAEGCGVPDPGDWPALGSAVALAQFGVDPELGLTALEVHERLDRYGPNALQEIRPRPPWRILLDQFASIVVALLGVAAAVAWITSDVLGTGHSGCAYYQRVGRFLN